jgi:Sulfatase
MQRPGNNYVLIIFDSCRYDSLIAAHPKTLLKLGEIEQRWSYASWTAPSHYNLLSGLLPHSSPKNVFASEYYKQDFLRFSQRLGIEGIGFKSLIPKLYFPAFLKESLGYRTHAMVSLPVLNPRTILNHGFDTFQLMEHHNDMRAMLKEMRFPEDRPSFYLLNVGETHYPYALPDEPPENWPRISGVHGVFKHLDEQVVGGKLIQGTDKFFNKAKMKLLRERQIRAVQYLDRVVEELFDIVPKNTYITITSDHGELFGESGFFGHGPIFHRKVFEVPFVEGLLR